jgi:hypothetical protein
VFHRGKPDKWTYRVEKTTWQNLALFLFTYGMSACFALLNEIESFLMSTKKTPFGILGSILFCVVALFIFQSAHMKALAFPEHHPGILDNEQRNWKQEPLLAFKLDLWWSGRGATLSPGDRLDLIAICQGHKGFQHAWVLLENIRVLKVDQKDNFSGTFLLEVTPGQAAKLKAAIKRGRIASVLVPPNS